MVVAARTDQPIIYLREDHPQTEASMKWRIGAVTVTKIVELEVTGGSRFLLPQATYEEILPIDWLRPDFADERGRLKMSIHALVVETPSRRIIVDTCLGNDKENRRIPTWNRLQTTFLADLAAAGYARETIDTVVCTHLHVDHVGWNTMLVDGRWVPTFPQARYLMGRVEFAHWTTQHEREDMAAVLADSVTPVFDAGLVDLVETDHRICDEISLMPTPGHTPGHVSLRIASEGEEALITGDFMHHPCQIARPDWSSTADSDPAAARPDARADVDPPCRYPDPGHRHAFRRPHRRPYRAATARPSASPSEIAGRFVDGRARLRRVEGDRLRQLYRRPGGGDGDVGFRRRGDQDRAAGCGRPLSPPGAAADRAGARRQSRLCARRPQQDAAWRSTCARRTGRRCCAGWSRRPTCSSPTIRRRCAAGWASPMRNWRRSTRG